MVKKYLKQLLLAGWCLLISPVHICLTMELPEPARDRAGSASDSDATVDVRRPDFVEFRMSMQERVSRRLTAPFGTPVPDVYLQIPSAGMLFSISQFRGDQAGLLGLYQAFVVGAQELQNRALYRDDNRVLAPELGASPSESMLPIAAHEFDAVVATRSAIAAPSTSSVSMEPDEPSNWVASVPVDLATLFEDAPRMPVASRGGGGASGGHAGIVRSRRVARACAAHQVSAARAASGSESKYREIADGESKRDKSIPRAKRVHVELEDMTVEQLLAYNPDSSDSDSSGGSSKRPRLPE